MKAEVEVGDIVKVGRRYSIAFPPVGSYGVVFWIGEGYCSVLFDAFTGDDAFDRRLRDGKVYVMYRMEDVEAT